MSKEQKPPQSPEQPNFPHDMRFTDDRIEALKGPTGLDGNSVEITGYYGTDQADDEVKHHMGYKDENDDTKYTTLDQFVWAHLSAERKDELARAGMNAYDLDAGTDPILGSPQAAEADRSGAPTARAEDLMDILAEGVASRLTGQARQRTSPQGKTSATNPSKPKKQFKPDTRSPQERLMASVAARRAQVHDEANEANEAFDFSKEASSHEHKHFQQVVEIAQAVAKAMNEKGIEPDLTVKRPWVDRRTKLVRKLDRTPKTKILKGVHEKVLAEGWLLARGAVASGSGLVVQELMLGTDGKLHVYIPDTSYDASSVINNPASRARIQRSSHRNSMPIGGLENVKSDTPGKDEKYYEKNTHPSTNKFLTLEPGADMHNIQIAGNVSVFADPLAIRQGLEDLAVETGVVA